MLFKTRPLIVASFIMLGMSACQSTTPSGAMSAQSVKQTAEDKKLNLIIDREWKFRTSADSKDKENSLSDLSADYLAAKNLKRLAFLRDVKAIDKSKLSAEQKINAEILIYQLQNAVDNYRFKAHQIPLTSESGFHAYIASIAKGSFKTVTDYENYLAKLSALPKYFDQQIAWLKEGLSVGNTPAQVVLKGFEQSIEAFLVPAQESTYFKPFTHFPDTISDDVKSTLRASGLAQVKSSVLPSYQKFYDFMVQEYIPNARKEIAAYELPNGKAFYQNRVRYFTTLDMTPEQVHELGLKEVKRIRTEMETIIEELEFEGSFSDFLHYLRTDPKFYAKSAEELLKEAAYIAKKADAVLPKYFGLLPRKPYGIVPVPAEIAPKYTTGRYSGASRDDQAGFYWVNTYALDKRPLYELEALTLHEAVPGHHLQISLNKELDHLPNFRRYSYISAFGEGWGLYAEYLGLEAGFYQDPYSNFGRLTYEMWRAARLVVDTGMHAMGWTREQALDFMASNTALSLHNVTTEIDRYISWPGQALSYKIGELTIKRLRNKAELELGEKFDIRAFHDAVLANGAIPLKVLELKIEEFIAKEKAKK